MIFADAHTHSNPIKGLGMRSIAPKFKEFNGWYMSIVGLSPWHYSFEPKLEGYEESLKLVLNEKKVIEENGLKAKAFFGFHPADVDKLMGLEGMTPEKVLELGLKVIDMIEKYIKAGLLDGIGEVGRQHYKTTPVNMVISELIMERALEVAKDYDVPVHLHLEQGGRVTAIDVKKRIERLGLDWRKIIVHHARGKSLEAAVEEGLRATVPGVTGSLERAAKLKPTYMVESDHIDDPKRPGTVVYPWEMVKNQLSLLERGLVDEEYLAKLNIDNVVETFGVEPP